MKSVKRGNGKLILAIKLEEIVSAIRNNGVHVGEINAATLKEICFEHQRYKRITVNDVKEAEKLLEILEGKNVEPRKQFIYDNATELGFNFM